MKKTILTLFIITAATAFSQDFLSGGRLTGNFQLDAQYYQKDSIIGAKDVPEDLLSNGFLNLNYSLGSFRAGIRYEAYLNPILGFPQEYGDEGDGFGIAYRFVEFGDETLEATAGDFYEQFGSGLIFRAYEERQLGFDNAVDGFRFKFRPAGGVELTGLIGKQRSFWDKGDGVVRGGDLNINVKDLTSEIVSPDWKLLPANWNVNLGASVVSKFQADKSSIYKFPENVLAYSGRFDLSATNFMFNAEYAYKYNDPNITNNFNYNPGRALLLSGSYFASGFGLSMDFHALDNFDFRSDRNAQGNNLNINYIPPLTKQHAYRLATMYPYATQYNGEIGFQGELTFKLPRQSLLGGKYGTSVAINFSRINSLDTTHNDEFTYDGSLLGFGDRLYFQDFNIDIGKRWSMGLKTHLAFISLIYDKDVLENEGVPKFGKIGANILVGEALIKLASRHSLRCELQHLWYEQDSTVKTPDNMNGAWFMALAEYTISPSWFFSIYDEYNYGNDDADRRTHYIGASVAYIKNTSRVSFGYGRQRRGTLCVGGVCRVVPASNGFYLSLTSSF